MPDSVRPHRRQPTRLLHPWDSPGKNTAVGCHFLLQCMKVKSKSEVTQWCLTLSDPMDCSLPGSSVHGIFQARVLEWGAIAVSALPLWGCSNSCPLSRWCYLTILSSAAPFSFCLQSLPASRSFPKSQLFVSGGLTVGASDHQHIQGQLQSLMPWWLHHPLLTDRADIFHPHPSKAQKLIAFSTFQAET